jgi:hypothetical protein
MKSVHVVVVVALVCLIGECQCSIQVPGRTGIVFRGVLRRTSPSLLFGWFNLKFMRHSGEFPITR